MVKPSPPCTFGEMPRIPTLMVPAKLQMLDSVTAILIVWPLVIVAFVGASPKAKSGWQSAFRVAAVPPCDGSAGDIAAVEFDWQPTTHNSATATIGRNILSQIDIVVYLHVARYGALMKKL